MMVTITLGQKVIDRLTTEQQETLRRHTPVPLRLPNDDDSPESLSKALGLQLDAIRQKDVAIEAAHEALRQYALSVPALSRAASEGYAVSPPALDHFALAIVANASKAGLEGFVIHRELPEYYQWRWCAKIGPSNESFETYDSILESMRNTTPPEGVELELLAIQRLDRRAPGIDDTFTAVMIKVSSMAVRSHRFLVIKVLK